MYGSNYYHHSSSGGEERVPIRWMAPGSIDTNIYNQATDVVSGLIAMIDLRKIFIPGGHLE